MEVLHEVDGRQDRCAYADLGDVLFDLVLAVEVRMPVCRLAEPAEVKTRCTPAALAASAADVPCRVSACVPPSNGVVIAKREVAPSSAFVSAAVSSSDARTSVTPAFASSLAFAESVLRVTARTS
jgi:hypothetical protein